MSKSNLESIADESSALKEEYAPTFGNGYACDFPEQPDESMTSSNERVMTTNSQVTNTDAM